MIYERHRLKVHNWFNWEFGVNPKTAKDLPIMNAISFTKSFQ